LSLECLLRPWRDVGGGSLPVFWVGVGRQPLRCFTLRARCNDNPRKVLGPTALRPNRYGSEPRRIARSRNNRRRHHASGRRRPRHTKPPDIVARVTGQALSERLGRQFVIENRPGAGSNIGTEIVVRAAPDGNTTRETDDDPHRPCWIGLRPCDARGGRQRGSARGKIQKFSAGKFHG